MNLDCIKKYYDKNLSRVTKYYGTSLDEFTVDSIHDLRVSIKRLRALNRMVKWIEPEWNQKKSFKPIRSLFKRAGKARDIHVQQELVRDYTAKLDLNLSEYYNSLKQKELKAKKKYLKFAEKFDLIVLEKNWNDLAETLKEYTPESLTDNIRKCLGDNLEQLISYKNKAGLEQDDYHKIRILSKESRYILEVLQICVPETDFKELDIKIRDLHRALGKWHDCQVGIDFLKDFLGECKSADFFDPESYAKLEDTLKSEMKSHMIEFEEKWQKFESHSLTSDFIEG